MYLIIFGRTAQFILAVAMVRIATTFLTPSEMGRMSLILSATAFFAIFLLSPVGMFINRRLHVWNLQGMVKKYLNYYWLYLICVAVVTAVVLIIANGFNLINFHTKIIWLLILVTGSILFTTANSMVIPALNFLGFRKEFIILTVATVGSSLVLAWLCVKFIHSQAEYWLSGLFFAQFIFAVIGAIVLFGKIPSKVESGDILRELSWNKIGFVYRFAWPMAISAGFTWIQTQSYRFLAEGSHGLDSLGLFVAGYSISAGIIGAFEVVLTTYLQPIFYKQVSSDKRNDQSLAWSEYAGVIFPSLLFLIFFIVATSSELTKLLLGPAYQQAAKFVVWGALAEAARVIGGVYVMVAQAKMKTKMLLVPNLIGAISSLLLIFWLLPKFGFSGVGVALFISGMAVILSMHVIMRAELDLKVSYLFLIKVFFMGSILVGVAIIGRIIIGDVNTVWLALKSFVVLSALFLAVQYWLLRPILHEKAVLS
jgi:O-antigen/teichoic acid export membrane protein